MNILYICTHNRCRSILSEAITNHLSNGKIKAFSAGSQPVGEVHPLSIKYLTQLGIQTNGLRSQSWHEFAVEQPDLVITVCDSAANETCPVWFGDVLKLHWPLADPSKLNGSEEDIRDAFMNVMNTIKQRVHLLLNTSLDGLSKDEKQTRLSNLVFD